MKRWCQLTTTIVLTSCVWLVVLPRLSRLPRQRAYLDALDDRGIDASAMFYTELPRELFGDELFWGRRLRDSGR